VDVYHDGANDHLWTFCHDLEVILARTQRDVHVLDHLPFFHGMMVVVVCCCCYDAYYYYYYCWDDDDCGGVAISDHLGCYDFDWIGCPFWKGLLMMIVFVVVVHVMMVARKDEVDSRVLAWAVPLLEQQLLLGQPFPLLLGPAWMLPERIDSFLDCGYSSCAAVAVLLVWQVLASFFPKVFLEYQLNLLRPPTLNSIVPLQRKQIPLLQESLPDPTALVWDPDSGLEEIN
jgi:hypothetical protein